MFGLKIFIRVQTFWRGPPVPPRNFCHPGSWAYYGQIVGQFGTGQFGTKITKTDNLAPAQFGTRSPGPGQFGTGQFGTRTIWQQTFDVIKLNLIEHFWQHLGQRFSFGVFVCPVRHKYG